MERNSNIESGIQFLSRMRVRPVLHEIEKTLFPNGLLNNETVEICGNSSSGKTLLLTQLMSKCILSVNHDGKLIGGLGVNVVFINTDHHFMILKLRDLLVDMLYKNGKISVNRLMVEEVVKQSINRLVIINCYSSAQYSLTLQSLNDILLKNEEIGLVVIDSIASYYWQDRETGGDWMVDRYIKNILKVVQKHTFTSKIPLIYTRSTYQYSTLSEKGTITCISEPVLGKINYKIKLIRSDDNKEFTCSIQYPKTSNEIKYTIGANGIMWINAKKRRTMN